jgi:putative solute:sodium symporter small subunit
MTGQNPRYQVNMFRPQRGRMRDQVLIIFVILFGWGIVNFGFQALVALTHGSKFGALLTDRTFFTLPVHFWFTGQFLPLWFIILGVVFNLYVDGIAEHHNRKRDRSYE